MIASALLLLPLVVSSQQQLTDELKRQVDALAPSCNANARVLIRAAFHDAGTYDQHNRNAPGGLDGSIQFELDRSENMGLETIVTTLVAIAHSTQISVADTIAYGGVRGFSICGGGNVTFQFGRNDTIRANARDRLPKANFEADDTVEMFVNRMGFSMEETVALIGGGHSTAAVHARFNPGQGWARDGFLDDTETVIDNNIYSR